MAGGWRLAGSLIQLRNQLDGMYPARSRVSDGDIGDAVHQATTSQHNPNSLGVVTALDITHSPGTGVDGQTLANLLIQDSRTWYVIFNDRIWEAGVWKPYQPNNPNRNRHTKHVHISTKQTKAIYDNATQWQLKQDITMTEDGVRYGIRAVTGGNTSGMDYEKEVRYWTGRSPSEFGLYLYRMSDNYMVSARKQLEQKNGLILSLQQDNIKLAEQIKQQEVQAKEAVKQAQATAPSATKSSWFKKFLASVFK